LDLLEAVREAVLARFGLAAFALDGGVDVLAHTLVDERGQGVLLRLGHVGLGASGGLFDWDLTGF
jgi:hypothetical protein